MEMFHFYLDNVLRPVFEDGRKLKRRSAQMGNNSTLADSELESDLEELDEQYDLQEQSTRAMFRANSTPTCVEVESLATNSDAYAGGTSNKSSRSRSKRRSRTKRSSPEDILDLNGPKLIEGCRVWILFYQLVGQLNWLGVPFYLSIIYKILLMALISYVGYYHLIKEFLELSTVDVTYRNPIFIFISFLAITSTAFNTVLAFYTNLFDLCPLFKVLTTPRLCFISEEVQHIIGTKTITCILIFYVYHSSLLLLLVHQDLDSFVSKFNLGRFVLFQFCSLCGIYHLIGLSHLDFYIRACFASWLIALKGNLECRFAHLHRHQRLHRLRASHRNCIMSSAGDCEDLQGQLSAQTNDETGRRSSNGSLATLARTVTSEEGCSSKQGEMDEEQEEKEQTESEGMQKPTTVEEFKQNYKIVTLDEIQKNLNTMDDHLEVCRSIQTSSLVLITLNAFLTNGALLLLAYNLLANRGNYYHGLLLILVVMNYTIIIFFSYIGDSWLNYALSSFVQTVEDEYFLQAGEHNSAEQHHQQQQANVLIQQQQSPRSTTHRGSFAQASGGGGGGGADLAGLSREHELLLIKKKDVLFCREFLHQFENHLATPWSKLTVKVHLRMVGTFVTLIAAQIIFDHEH